MTSLDGGHIVTLVSLLIIIVALVPVVRVMLKRPVWAEVGNRPLVALVTLGLVGAALLFAIGFAADLARWLPLLAAVAAVASLVAHWRARSQFGVQRGLPVGSLGVAESLDAISRQDFYAVAARRFGPIFKMAQFHRPVVCIASLPLGLQVMREQRDNLVLPRLPFGRVSPGYFIAFLSDQRHPRYRAILGDVLVGDVLVECRHDVEAVVRRELSRIAAPEPDDGVDPEQALQRITLASMWYVLSGIQKQDAQLDDLIFVFDGLGATRTLATAHPEESTPAFARLIDILRADGSQALTLREARGRSILCDILRADPAHLFDDILLGNLILIAHVTRSNIGGILRWVVKEYSDNPRYSVAARDASVRTGAGSAEADDLATQFVSETLRMHQSEFFYREVQNEIRVGTFRIPRGWLLRVCVRESHDDAIVFAEPETFRPERFANRLFAETEYCPFSDGTHSTFGAGLARMIACSLFTVLAREFDGRAVADGPVEREGNRHWSHWRPSSKLRVSLKRREELPRSLEGGAETVGSGGASITTSPSRRSPH